MAEFKRKHSLKNGVGDTLSALVFTALVVAVAAFGFSLRTIKHTAGNVQARPGSQLRMLSQLSETERANSLRWYTLRDPTIPARGNAGVGFSVIPEAKPALVPLAALPPAVDPPEKIPDMPDLPALDLLPELSLLPPVDLSWAPRESSDAVLLWQSNGSPLPCPGLFTGIPSGVAVRSTVIRIIPVGGGLSRLVLAESCGDAVLDSYAQQELAKLKFDTGNVVTVCWPLSVRKK